MRHIVVVALVSVVSVAFIDGLFVVNVIIVSSVDVNDNIIVVVLAAAAPIGDVMLLMSLTTDRFNYPWRHHAADFHTMVSG